MDEVVETRNDRLRRARWRLRGAWLWPSFALMTLADAAILHWLPMSGDGTGWVPAFLLAGCLNLVVIAAGGGAGGWWLRRRRPDLPKVVADDYAGTVLVFAVTAVFLAIGLVHRPQVVAEREDFSAQSQAFRQYVAHQARPEFQRRIDEADSIQIDAELYRTCVPGNDPLRWLCVFVDTSDRPPTTRRDLNGEPNAKFDASGGYR